MPNKKCISKGTSKYLTVGTTYEVSPDSSNRNFYRVVVRINKLKTKTIRVLKSRFSK